MKTFKVKATHPDQKRFRIVCWAFSRNDTSFDIYLDGETTLGESEYIVGTYAAANIKRVTHWTITLLNKGLGIISPVAPPVAEDDVREALLAAINVCESLYGRNSAEEGDAEVVFVD